MLELLREHVVKNIWCTPDQDDQYIFAPARLCDPHGVRHYQRVEWETVYLPDSENTWHLYQIGQLNPHYLNILPDRGEWYCATTLCNHNNLIVNAYVNDGRQFPRGNIFFKKTRNKNVLIAIRNAIQLPRLVEKTLYVRFYYNGFFRSTRSTVNNSHVEIASQRVSSRVDVINFQQKILDLKKQKGHVSQFHNGWLVDNTHPDMVAIDDFIEYEYDGSIKEVVDFKVSNLKTFQSTLDKTHKYLLSREKNNQDIIDYHDDIDVFLYKEKEKGIEGVYYHRNQPQSIRQLTHKDYSTPTQRLVAFTNSHEHWNNVNELTLRMHIRHSGYERPLTYESSRIHELYRLTNDQIHRAMTGANSSVSFWRAAALEQSGYVRAMGSRWEQIDYPLVQEALGYHAAVKYLADTPSKVLVTENGRQAAVPIGLRDNSTVFEYDKDGTLLHWSHHTSGSEFYSPFDNKTRLVEIFAGKGSEVFNTFYGTQPITIEPFFTHRFYVSSAIAGIGSGDWRKAKKEDWEIIDGIVHWKTDLETTMPAVRNDRQFLLYAEDVTFKDGYLSLTIKAEENHQGEWKTRVVTLPYGHLDIFLNGKTLIENIDYFVRWPEVIIVNKSFLTYGEQQEIVVRATGFCRDDLTREPPSDVGYVTHGRLSHNYQYDVRDDKVFAVVVDGGLKHPDDLDYAENDTSLFIDNHRNGAPYQIKDIVAPIRGVEGTDAYYLRDKSLQDDKELRDYMTLVYPQTTVNNPSIIPHRHLLYSPFLSTIHERLHFNQLVISQNSNDYTDNYIHEVVDDFKHLLDVEPLLSSLVDERYVLVHPHRFIGDSSLYSYQYAFFAKVIEMFFPGKVDITHSVTLR